MIANFRKKQKSDHLARQVAFQAAGVVLIIFVAGLIIADVRIYEKSKELSGKISDYKRQIENLKEQNEKLNIQIVGVNSQDYLEKVAYEQLGEQKPGENVVLFIDQTIKKETPQPVEKISAWDNFFSWIKSPFLWIKSKF